MNLIKVKTKACWRNSGPMGLEKPGPMHLGKKSEEWIESGRLVMTGRRIFYDLYCGIRNQSTGCCERIKRLKSILICLKRLLYWRTKLIRLCALLLLAVINYRYCSITDNLVISQRKSALDQRNWACQRSTSWHSYWPEFKVVKWSGGALMDPVENRSWQNELSPCHLSRYCFCNVR